MNKKNKLYTLVAIVLVILAIASYSILAYYKNNESDKSPSSQQDVVEVKSKREISYKGEDGKTALELLRQKANLDVSEEGFVNSIDGVAADSTKNEYWSFTVDGEMANEGAGTYITKSSETINWKLTTF